MLTFFPVSGHITSNWFQSQKIPTGLEANILSRIYIVFSDFREGNQLIYWSLHPNPCTCISTLETTQVYGEVHKTGLGGTKTPDFLILVNFLFCLQKCYTNVSAMAITKGFTVYSI